MLRDLVILTPFILLGSFLEYLMGLIYIQIVCWIVIFYEIGLMIE